MSSGRVSPRVRKAVETFDPDREASRPQFAKGHSSRSAAPKPPSPKPNAAAMLQAAAARPRSASPKGGAASAASPRSAAEEQGAAAAGPPGAAAAQGGDGGSGSSAGGGAQQQQQKQQKQKPQPQPQPQQPQQNPADARQAWAAARATANGSRPEGGRYQTKGARQCKNCGGWGHFQKTCPLRFGQDPSMRIYQPPPNNGQKSRRSVQKEYVSPWMQELPPEIPRDSSWSDQVFHAREGSRKHQPPVRDIPYSGSEKGRFDKLKDIGVVAGEWTPEEDAALVAMVTAEGAGEWTTKCVRLGASCGFRSSTAIRKRWNRLSGLEPSARSKMTDVSVLQDGGWGDSGNKRKVPPEFDNEQQQEQDGAAAAAATADGSFPQDASVCKGCIPRSKAKHTCGKQYSQATAARRYGADYVHRAWGNDGKIVGSPRSANNSDGGRAASPVSPEAAQAAPGVMELTQAPQHTASPSDQSNMPKGECDFCRRTDGGDTVRSGCSCRDDYYGCSGYVHVTCLMKAAEEEPQIMHDCPKCEQRWTGELAIELGTHTHLLTANYRSHSRVYLYLFLREATRGRRLPLTDGALSNRKCDCNNCRLGQRGTRAHEQ